MSITRRFAVSFLALLTFNLLVVRTQAQDRLPGSTIQRIEIAVKKTMEAERIPGLSIAVGRDYDLKWQEGFGYSDIENEVPTRPETMFRLASIAKTITATAAMLLVEEGKLDLDAPIQKYVPSFPEKRWPITTRQLLGHLAGIRNYRGDEVNSVTHYTDRQTPLAIFKDDPLTHEPGSRYVYTTYGFNLAGAAVEHAAGMPFMDFIRKRIFEQSGTHAIRDDDSFAIIPFRAQGYKKINGGIQNSAMADTSNKIPGGGLIAPAGDLVRFANALLAGRIVKPESITAMWTPQHTNDGKPTTYGMGWAIYERAGVKEISHSGGQPRVATLLYLLPEKKIVVAIMCNLEGARLIDLAREVADMLWK
jgi:CubicO group peptidase (beta-lactamase class C family)